MHSITVDLCHASRMLRRDPGSFLLALLALTLGIGANTAVFTVVNGVLLRSLPYPEANRLLLISDAARDGRRGPVMRLSDRDYVEFRRRDRLFDGLATFDANGVDVIGAGEPVHLLAGNVTADFMRLLGIRPIMGRTFTRDDERGSGLQTVVLGNSLWQERFGADPDVIGREIKLDGIDHTIIGVMPPGFAYPDEAQLWIPMEVRVEPHVTFLRPVVGRLKSGATWQQARAGLQSILRPGRAAEVRPFQELVVSRVRQPLLIFAGAAGFVLLVACANVANLLLIRAGSRRQEIATRAAIGAGTWRLIRQLLTESALLSLIGGITGLLLAMWGVPLVCSQNSVTLKNQGLDVPLLTLLLPMSERPRSIVTPCNAHPRIQCKLLISLLYAVLTTDTSRTQASRKSSCDFHAATGRPAPSLLVAQSGIGQRSQFSAKPWGHNRSSKDSHETKGLSRRKTIHH